MNRPEPVEEAGTIAYYLDDLARAVVPELVE